MARTKTSAPKPVMAGPKPLSSRPLDAIYIAWFAIHLVIMFNVDMVAIYPVDWTPQHLLSLRQWYIATYRDHFFVEPPAWFLSFIWMEAVYHVPLSLWALKALKEDHPLVPAHLLVWSVQTFITTLVCIVDIASWSDLSKEEFKGLLGLYGPYCALGAHAGLAVFIGLDMFARLRTRLTQQVMVKQD